MAQGMYLRGEVWAKVSRPARNKSITPAVPVKWEKQLSFIIRYGDDIEEETNIWFEGRGSNIGFIDDVKYNREYMEIKAEYSKGVDNPNEDN